MQKTFYPSTAKEPLKKEPNKKQNMVFFFKKTKI